jgi:hypothetical protein
MKRVEQNIERVSKVVWEEAEIEKETKTKENEGEREEKRKRKKEFLGLKKSSTIHRRRYELISWKFFVFFSFGFYFP